MKATIFNFESLDFDMFRKKVDVTTFDLDYNGHHFIVFVDLSKESKSDDQYKYAKAIMSYYRVSDGKMLRLGANRNGLMINKDQIVAVREYFDISYLTYKQYHFDKLEDKLARLIPHNYHLNQLQKEYVINYIERQYGGDGTAGMYLYAIRKTGRRKAFNQKKTVILMGHTFVEDVDRFIGDEADKYSFCYTNDPVKGHSEQEIINNLGNNLYTTE